MAAKNGKRNYRHNGLGKPDWQFLTKPQIEAFLEHVREGHDRPAAAAQVKEHWPRSRASAKAFRALARHDPRFDADYNEAREAGRDPIAEKLRRRLVDAALDPEQHSSRFLQMALVLYDDEARVLIGRQRVELTGKDGGPLEHRHFDPTKLTEEQLGQLDSLLEIAATEE